MHLVPAHRKSSIITNIQVFVFISTIVHVSCYIFGELKLSMPILLSTTFASWDVFFMLVYSAMPFVFKLMHTLFPPFIVPEVKRRKRHRRKHFENQEPCLMRGVYFKNMKWQAAIKVDKKQIHLGTVGSQEEAARLYDR